MDARDGAGAVDEPGVDASPVDVLRRWEDSGAIWRVVSATGSGVTVALLTCDAREEVDRLTSSDPRLAEWIATRTGSQPD